MLLTQFFRVDARRWVSVAHNRDQAFDGQNCTETMQVHDAGEKFHDEDLGFDRNSLDDRLATVSHAMAEKLDHMHYIQFWRKCGRHDQ